VPESGCVTRGRQGSPAATCHALLKGDRRDGNSGSGKQADGVFNVRSTEVQDCMYVPIPFDFSQAEIDRAPDNDDEFCKEEGQNAPNTVRLVFRGTESRCPERWKLSYILPSSSHLLQPILCARRMKGSDGNLPLR
jgi:hypothetical protein